MKIAIWHNLPTGGGLRALDDQMRGLAERGHELHLWAPPSAARPASADVASTTHEVPLDVPVSRRPAERLQSAWRGRRPDLEQFAEHSARCAREITALGPDVVLAHSCQFYRVPAIAAYLSIPSAVYLHEPNRRLYEATSGFPWVASREARPLGPSSAKRFVGEAVDVELSRIQVKAETEWVHAFDRVLVNSYFSRESTLRAYACDSQLSLLGIDTATFRLVERPAQTLGKVLSVGALVPEKNVDFLLRAVAAAGPSVRQFTWVANYIDGPYGESMRQLATDLGVPLDIRHAISEAELAQCYADADVFVYAPRLEPFGYVPLEAGATGLPVVAVAEAGVRETVVDGVNGIVVEPDERAFGAAVAALLDDPARARSLGRSGRDYVESSRSLAAAIDGLEQQLVAVSSAAGSGGTVSEAAVRDSQPAARAHVRRSAAGRLRPLLGSVKAQAVRPRPSPQVVHRVRHDLEGWAQSYDGAAYTVLDPAAVTTRALPRTIEAAVHPSFAPLCSVTVPERALVKIPGGRVRGQAGLVVLPTDEFAGELVAMTPDGQHTMLQAESSYSEPLPPRTTPRSGSFYPVLGLGVTHYYHWSHDIIMRMRGVADLLPRDTQLIVPERLRPFQAETLSLLGLDEHPRVTMSGEETWEVESLYVVKPTLKTQIDTAEPYEWFREAVMTRYGIAEAKPTRRLYLSRKNDGHWRTTNEAEVESVLGELGFTTVSPGELSFREQAELFCEAEVIVGTGAGLLNMVFAPPGAQVLQFQDPDHIVHALWTMACATGVDYHYLMCEPVRAPGAAIGDMRVPVDKLRGALALLNSSRAA